MSWYYVADKAKEGVRERVEAKLIKGEMWPN